MNRLKLDFTLESASERAQFIDTYIVQFPDLTNSEAETIANYLLWGKDSKGKAIGAETELETKWSKTSEVDSLDAVLENPALANVQVHPLNEAVPLRKKRVVFSRSETRKNAPPHLLHVFEDLWRAIDETDLLINFYEERTGKRDKPPREELLKRFTAEEIDDIKQKSQKLNQYTYLKKRHELVEMRREQFTLSDSYTSTLNLTNSIFQTHNNTVVFDCEVEVLPLGLKKGTAADLVFNLNFDPGALNEKQLRFISKLVWQKKAYNGDRFFDFCNLEAVYQLYLFKLDFLEQIERDKESINIESNLEDLLLTLDFYEELADLTDIQLEILRMKEKHEKNSDIAHYVNKKYGKSYTANYISTIFRQKIITKINEAAELHRETIENCFFPENFKRCPDCGRVLLLDARNWVRKSRSKDGFQNKCKKCEKKGRNKA